MTSGGNRSLLLLASVKVDRMNFFNFWKFKYLLSIDGTVAAYRVPALLAVSPGRTSTRLLLGE